jgi:hypothetical protein
MNREVPIRDRETVMARLARKIARGHDAIYHGTRHLPAVLRTGKLLPSRSAAAAVFLTRSPEVASYWANMMGSEIDHFCGGVLVLNRASLAQIYRLRCTRWKEDWFNEQEESVWGRAINLHRHLLGVVQEADVNAIIGAPKYRFLPTGREQQKAFWDDFKASIPKVREGRAKVREIIVKDREKLHAARPDLVHDPLSKGSGVEIGLRP